jgi:hypothetical protein
MALLVDDADDIDPIEELRVTGRVTLLEVLDVVAAVGDEPTDVDAQIMKIYDWHHARGVAGLQLAFAPGAVAALALVAQDGSPAGVPTTSLRETTLSVSRRPVS